MWKKNLGRNPLDRFQWIWKQLTRHRITKTKRKSLKTEHCWGGNKFCYGTCSGARVVEKWQERDLWKNIACGKEPAWVQRVIFDTTKDQCMTMAYIWRPWSDLKDFGDFHDLIPYVPPVAKLRDVCVKLTKDRNVIIECFIALTPYECFLWLRVDLSGQKSSQNPRVPHTNVQYPGRRDNRKNKHYTQSFLKCGRLVPGVVTTEVDSVTLRRV